jgi:hypothetical protein
MARLQRQVKDASLLKLARWVSGIQSGQVLAELRGFSLKRLEEVGLGNFSHLLILLLAINLDAQLLDLLFQALFRVWISLAMR